MMVNAYQLKRRVYDHAEHVLPLPKRRPEHGGAHPELLPPGPEVHPRGSRLLDMCLLVHADHGGGNCSTFTTRVLSSSGTDTYSAIAAAIGAEGPQARRRQPEGYAPAG